MHLITEDPTKGKDLSLIRKKTATATAPIKKDSMLTALKNKIVDKTSDIMSARPRYKTQKSKENADYEVGVAKRYREIMKGGYTESKSNSKGATGDKRTLAEFSRLKDKYK